ncbi:MAG: CheW protein [Frankiales bacterium]|nr:CheW protein [Frankiales bacterium]
MNHLVTFRIGERDYAARLGDVREVVRLQGLADLPGMAPPLAGVLDLRGAALPVLDLRLTPGSRGDVLVLEQEGSAPVGVAVDAVSSVVDDGELPASSDVADELPSYVLEVLRGSRGPVFLVDLRRMVDSRRAVSTVAS